MITVWINEQSYQVAHSWGDITLNQAATLHALKMPDSLRHVYDIQFRSAGMSESELSEKIMEAEKLISIEDQHKNIPRYFGAVAMTLSDIPAEVIRQTDTISIRAIYHTYLKKFVEGVLFMPTDYNHIDISHFKFRDIEYYLPVDKKVFGQAVPMVDVSALEFTESADLMIYLTKLQEDKDLTRIANLVSILCRPEGEPYDENTSLARAELFKELPMNICWDVFFSLITPLIILSQSAQISLLQDMAAEKREAMNPESLDGTEKSYSLQELSQRV